MAKSDFNAGSRQSPLFVEPVPKHLFLSAGAMAADTAYLHKFRVEASILVSKIQVSCSSAGGAGNVDANIYTSDGTTWTRVAGASTPVAVSAATMDIPLAAAVLLLPGIDYWAAMACSEATSTFNRVTVSSAVLAGGDNDFIRKVTSNPLPATITTPATNNLVAWMRLHV